MGNDAHAISGGGSIALNVRRVLDGIANAAIRAGRDPDGVTLLAVSKTRPVHEIAEIVGTGILNVGENRVQEAASKIPEMTAAVPMI